MMGCLFSFQRRAAGEGTEGDPNIIFCNPEELRPITCKNGDNKVVASVIKFCISPVVQKCASEIQQGFINKRNFGMNIDKLDQVSRVHTFEHHATVGSPDFFEVQVSAEKYDIGMMPLIMLFDFAAAFPIVAHAWLFAVLKGIGIPRGFLNVIKKCLKM